MPPTVGPEDAPSPARPFDEKKFIDGDGRIAVGTPTSAYTARAPSPSHYRQQPYRADTIVDGWTEKCLTVRAASVRGDLHRFSGVPRQDDFALGYHEATGSVVVAVADGVSSAPNSQFGATAACRSAVAVLLRQLDRGEEIDWPEVVSAAAWAVVEVHRELAAVSQADPVTAEQQCACTLVAAAIRPEAAVGAEVSAVALGDSSLGVLEDGRIQLIAGGKISDESGLLAQAVVGLPRVPVGLEVVRRVLKPGEVLLIGTDGIWDPLGSGTGALGDLVRRELGAGAPEQIRFYRLVDFSRETFTDDRTLVAVWFQRAESP